nr:helix-turn-helix transcriptional regulator [uncultured Chryseobacterium sp.]
MNLRLYLSTFQKYEIFTSINIKIIALEMIKTIAKITMVFLLFLGHERDARASGESQKEVALTLSMNPSQYSKIENGKVDPQFFSIEKIANALGVSIADICKF